MLKIRNEQMQIFNQIFRDEFYNKVLFSLRKNLPAQTKKMDDETLKKRIIKGCEDALSYEIKTQKGVIQYITLNLIFGEQFDNMPKINEYLNHNALDGDQKINLLSNMLEYHSRQGN